MSQVWPGAKVSDAATVVTPRAPQFKLLCALLTVSEVRARAIIRAISQSVVCKISYLLILMVVHG